MCVAVVLGVKSLLMKIKTRNRYLLVTVLDPDLWPKQHISLHLPFAVSFSCTACTLCPTFNFVKSWPIFKFLHCWKACEIYVLTEYLKYLSTRQHCHFLQRIRGFFKWYALYKFTFYLLTYLLKLQVALKRAGWLQRVLEVMSLCSVAVS